MSERENPTHMERAERMVDDLADHVGRVSSVVGAQVTRLMARAREKAKEIHAEAQALRTSARNQ